jgi:hypothetical protein
MTDKDYTHYNLDTLDLISLPGFSDAKIYIPKINKKRILKINKIFKIKKPL